MKSKKISALLLIVFFSLFSFKCVQSGPTYDSSDIIIFPNDDDFQNKTEELVFGNYSGNNLIKDNESIFAKKNDENTSFDDFNNNDIESRIVEFRDEKNLETTTIKNYKISSQDRIIFPLESTTTEHLKPSFQEEQNLYNNTNVFTTSTEVESSTFLSSSSSEKQYITEYPTTVEYEILNNSDVNSVTIKNIVTVPTNSPLIDKEADENISRNSPIEIMIKDQNIIVKNYYTNVSCTGLGKIRAIFNWSNSHESNLNNSSSLLILLKENETGQQKLEFAHLFIRNEDYSDLIVNDIELTKKYEQLGKFNKLMEDNKKLKIIFDENAFVELLNPKISCHPSFEIGAGKMIFPNSLLEIIVCSVVLFLSTKL